MCRLTAIRPALARSDSVVMEGLLGFDPKLAVQPLATIPLLKAPSLFIPFVCLLAGGVIVMTHPITRRRQTAIQRRLDRRLGGAAGALVGAPGVEPAIGLGPLGHGLGEAAALGSVGNRMVDEGQATDCHSGGKWKWS
jgi:hypothetical protein